jgi:hypothetical protein
MFSNAGRAVGAPKPAALEMRNDKSQSDKDAGQRTPDGVAIRNPEASDPGASP